MPVYDYDGSSQRAIGTIYDYNKSVNSQIKTGYDYDGSASRVVYELDETVYLYKNGVTGSVYTGPWIGIGSAIHPNRTSNVIASPYGSTPGTFYDSGGILYIDNGTTCCGGMRTREWIPWTSFQGKTCYCDAVIYAKPWGYEDYKYNRYIPYIDCALWTSNYTAVGNTVSGRSVAFSGYYTTPPNDSSGAKFDGYVNNDKLYEWRVTLSFKCPSYNGWLFFTMSHGVPCYGQIRTSTIYIK